MGQIVLVRHGQASFGARDYDQLSELGAEQSRRLGAWMAEHGWRFDRVVTGRLRRHRQTAEACCAALPAPPAEHWQADAGFDEYDHEDVLRCSRPEFSQPGAIRAHLEAAEDPQRAFRQVFDAAMRRWMGGAHDGDYRESWPAFRARCVGALAALAQDAAPEDNIVVFTSGGAIATVVQDLLGLPDEKVAVLTWSLVNSSATKLLHRRGRLTLSTLNGHAHLERAGQAQFITYR